LGALTPVRMGEALGQAKSEGDIVAPPPASPQL